MTATPLAQPDESWAAANGKPGSRHPGAETRDVSGEYFEYLNTVSIKGSAVIRSRHLMKSRRHRTILVKCGAGLSYLHEWLDQIVVLVLPVFNLNRS
jgi:hypothetical protein